MKENRTHGMWKGRNSRHDEQRLKDFVRKLSFSKLWNNYFLQLHMFVNRLSTGKKSLDDMGGSLSEEFRLFPEQRMGECGCSGHALGPVELGRSYIIYFVP